MTDQAVPPVRAEAWEMIVSELTVAMHADRTDAADLMPAALAARLIADGERTVRAAAGPVAVALAPSTESAWMRRARLVRPWSGWLAAAAALLLWWPAPSVEGPTSVRGATRLAQATAQLRDSLMRSDGAVTRADWSATSDASAAGAGGDVIWSARSQRGVMRLTGLQPNDRARWQYQLWIFDKRRDQRYPVDGGVFDIPAGATEVLVPIQARLAVGEAILFAITVEAPGGVVVSTRERVALLAKAGG